MASMPAEHAPERMISAFSMMTTLSLGSILAASTAEKHPALPPPMMSTSQSTRTVSTASSEGGLFAMRGIEDSSCFYSMKSNY